MICTTKDSMSQVPIFWEKSKKGTIIQSETQHTIVHLKRQSYQFYLAL